MFRPLHCYTDLQVTVSLFISKVTVFIFFITSPRKSLWKLLGPRLLRRAQLLLILLNTNTNSSQLLNYSFLLLIND